MRMTTREFLKSLGLGGAALAAGRVLGDEYVRQATKLPPGSVGDPDDVRFGQHMFAMAHSMEDVPSAFLRGGKVIQPEREIPQFHTCDVCVVGGGPAGFCAAIAAARSGARVAVVERYGSMGGLFTNGLVLVIIGTGEVQDGKFRLLTRGICEEYMLRVGKMGPRCSTQPGPGDAPGGKWQPTLDPEASKVLMDVMAREEKVDVFYHSWGVDVIQDGNAVKGVVFESKQGRQAILAKCVVDATGDGDVYFQAGADYKQITHSLGTVMRVGGLDKVDAAKAAAYDPAKNDVSKFPGYTPDDDRWFRNYPIRGNEPSGANWEGPLGPAGNGLDVRTLSKAEMDNRIACWHKVRQMQRTPGWESAYVMQTCSQLGVRGTRLLKSSYMVNRAEAIKGKRDFADTVAMSGDHALFRPGFGIPYRSLLPVGVKNVIAAGRCIGAEGDITDRVRLIPVCMVTGEAAGVAAALAARRGVSPDEIAADEVRKELLKRNACLA